MGSGAFVFDNISCDGINVTVLLYRNGKQVGWWEVMRLRGGWGWGDVNGGKVGEGSGWGGGGGRG